MWCAVEVCGFGVPLPGSNLLAARVSKNCCNEPNLDCFGIVRKRFLNSFERICNDAISYVRPLVADSCRSEHEYRSI